MATTEEENWMICHNEQNIYVAVYYHYTDKYKVKFCSLLIEQKHTQKKIKARTCPKIKDSASKHYKPVGLTNILHDEGKK